MFQNSIWLLGNGEDINFWNDNWCGTPLSDTFNIPDQIKQSLSSKVSDYIFNGQWNLPCQLTHQFSNLSFLVQQITIPNEPSNDKLLWKHTDTGELNLSDAYRFKLQQFQDLHWAKLIWNPDIPPSKSCLAWRLMHNKVPTDENLMLRGCALPSMCSLCNKNVESSFHIFFECNNSKQSSSNSIRDFIVLKHFKVSIHPPKIPLLKEVLWQPPLVNWIKCNIDGAAKGNPGIAACGGVFRNSDANFIFCFAEPLGFASSYQAELCAAMTAIEIAHTRNWHNLWLETDSTLVVLAFKNSNTKVAWNLRNRWHNAILAGSP
ncbi:hypothetical protein TSUD_163410 [Trifolium subterraneum]|uniref:RNase H type-1 domain-containing protein n=1 Tax=Trifolium subterraneum TaxID=3900 RepID=A0A2Z6MZH4_TRISU|nr:hypothetical protein TSUD_163410 [Trifolium subterraneum]